MLVEVVLLGKLHVLQEFWIASWKFNNLTKFYFHLLPYFLLTLHAHVPLQGGFPEPVAMILPALVVSRVILRLGHT